MLVEVDAGLRGHRAILTNVVQAFELLGAFPLEHRSRALRGTLDPIPNVLLHDRSLLADDDFLVSG
jgi:hypothetical protein